MKRRLLGSFPARVIRRYSVAGGGTWATAIAWNALFAFFPIVITVMAILGIVLRGSGESAALETRIADSLPGQQGTLIIEALRGFRTAAGPLAVIGIVGLLWSGSTLFSAIDRGLDALHPAKPRTFVRQKLMGVGMIVVFTLLVLPAIASSSLLSIIDRLPGIPGVLTARPVALVVQIAFGALDGAVLFAAIYLVVPNRRQALRTVLPGALTAGALFELLNLLFPLYLAVQGGFSAYGATFAFFFVLMTYAFWLAQIVMLGGAINAELDPPRPGEWPRAGLSTEPARRRGGTPDDGRHARASTPARRDGAAVD